MVFILFRSVVLFFVGALFALSCSQPVAARPGFNLLHYVLINGRPAVVSDSQTIFLPSGTAYFAEETPTISADSEIPTPTIAPAESDQPAAQALNADAGSFTTASVLATAVVTPSSETAQTNSAIKPFAATGFILVSTLSVLYQLV